MTTAHSPVTVATLSLPQKKNIRLLLTGMVVGLRVLVMTQGGEGAGSPDLAELGSVDIVIEELLPETTREGVEPEALRAELLEQVKAKIPRLQIWPGSPDDTLSLLVLLNQGATTSGRRTGAYYGWVRLALYRRVMVAATGKFTMGILWAHGAIIAGPSGDARSNVNEAIGDLVRRFAAAYYKAGNP